MVNDAATFKAQDEVALQRVEAKSHLDSYCASMREAMKSIASTSAGVAQDVLNKTMEWCDKQTESTTKEMFEAKIKELQSVCEPILAAQAQEPGHGEQPSVAAPPQPFASAAAAAAKSSGPKVEEVD